MEHPAAIPDRGSVHLHDRRHDRAAHRLADDVAGAKGDAGEPFTAHREHGFARFRCHRIAIRLFSRMAGGSHESGGCVEE